MCKFIIGCTNKLSEAEFTRMILAVLDSIEREEKEERRRVEGGEEKN
jgi:hypothetical protein